MDVLAAQRLTLDDFLARPETNTPTELVQGQVVVIPAPTGPHQVAIMRLGVQLTAAVPDGYEVVPSPIDWIVSSDEPATVRQPDIVVATSEQARAPRLTEPPLVVVEVLSPGCREVDLVTKRRTYAMAGAPYYWLVDPDIPAIRVERNVGGEYVELASAIGDEELIVDEPFPVRLRPSELVD